MNNYYEELELAENPPEKPLIDRLIRHILVEKPRVTKFQIQWDDQAQSSGGLDAMNQGGMMMMSAQEQQQMEEGCLQPGTQFKDRNDMMSSANLQAAADYFGGGAPQ